MVTCRQCGLEFVRGPRWIYCSDACLKAGNLARTKEYQAARDPATSKEARRLAIQNRKCLVVCELCGETWLASVKTSRFCPRHPTGIIRNPEDKDFRRWQREVAAPGLGRTGRAKLLRKWQRQGRTCWSCGSSDIKAPDHIVPLSRGGTNYEGNLAPVCWRCNSSRGARLVAEWRHRVRDNGVLS